MTQPQQTTGTHPATSYDPVPAPTPASTGRFVWHDLMSTDPERALAFYQALLGWTTTETEMDEGFTYTMLLAGGQGIGGIVPLDPAHDVPSHWIGYLSVESVDRAVERVAELGGRACVPPTDIPNVGRFAVVEDATGAVFSPFSCLPGQEDAGQAGPVPFGAFCWDELLTTDPDAASRFYAGLVGWSYHAMDMGELGSYWTAGCGESSVTGMMRLPAEARQAGARSHWLPYVHVADVDAAATGVTELGGTVLVPPSDIPDIGRFAIAQDPAGAPFALYHPSSRG